MRIITRTFRRYLTMAQATPIEDSIRSKLTQELSPTSLEIHNDSHKHSHHKAMEGSTSNETHFRVIITSEAFQGKMQPARHRLIYNMFKEEMARDGGIHALQLQTRTPAEVAKLQAKEQPGEKQAE